MIKVACAHFACRRLKYCDLNASILQVVSGEQKDLKAAPQLPIVLASEILMKKLEAREGMQLELSKAARCTVSFSRGAEKTVLFAVHGVPQVSTAITQATCTHTKQSN